MGRFRYHSVGRVRQLSERFHNFAARPGISLTSFIAKRDAGVANDTRPFRSFNRAAAKHFSKFLL
jgi:hypothetical protein